MAKKHVEPQGFTQPVAYERCARSGCRGEATKNNPNDERERVCAGCYAVEFARWSRWSEAGRPRAELSISQIRSLEAAPKPSALEHWPRVAYGTHCGGRPYPQDSRNVALAVLERRSPERDREPGEDDE